MSSNECSICASTFSSKVRKSIECIFCKKCCCKQCFSTFMKDQSAPKCMFCNTEFTMDFVEENTTLKFMKEYNSHLCDLQFSVERSKLPATQRLAEIVRRIDHYNMKRQKTQIKIRQKYNEIFYNRHYLQSNDITPDQTKENKKEFKKLCEERRSMIAKLENIARKKDYLLIEKTRQINILIGVGDRVVDDDEKTFSRPCLATDCRGFLSKSYKCGTCDKYFCADCHETKQSRVDETHVCNEEAKATIALIVKDSKPCPKCSIPIEKVSGCSQMWCVSCHTTFDWNTMKIETGYIHNPEYLRWMRENNNVIPRNPYDPLYNDCNAMPEWYNIAPVLGEDITIDWMEVHRKVLHINYIKNELQYEENDLDYVNLRVEYLLSRISEEIWRKKFGMLVKKNNLRQERYNVCDLYYNAMKDLFLNVMVDKDIDKLKQSVQQLEDYANGQFTKINKKYESKDKRFAEIKNM